MKVLVQKMYKIVINHTIFLMIYDERRKCRGEYNR